MSGTDRIVHLTNSAYNAPSCLPLYVAVSVSGPTAVGTSAQAPVDIVPWQLAPELSVTVTVSVLGIVPPPGALTITL